MNRIAGVIVVGLFGVAAASAQFLQSSTGGQGPSGGNTATCLDGARLYTVLNNSIYFEKQFQSSSQALGTTAGASTTPWNATYRNGVVSSTGEAATALGTLLNGPKSAVFNAVDDCDSQLSSTVTGAGPYYGVNSYSLSSATSLLSFTVAAAATITAVGNFTASGPQARLVVELMDTTANIQTYLLNQKAGSFPINFSQGLVANDSYTLTVLVESGSSFDYNPNVNVTNLGYGGAAGYFTATFLPAPEPVSCGLLGLSAAMLVRGRSRAARKELRDIERRKATC